MAAVFIFLFGLAVGSFLNAFLWRLEKGESVFHGRSYCPKCSHTLSWPDLIPLLSFAFLGGRCRYCKQSISWRYPLVECAAALLFLGIFFFVFSTQAFSVRSLLYFSYLLAVSSCLLGLFLYDLKHYLLPDRILYTGLAVSFIWYAASLLLGVVSLSSVAQHLMGAVIASAVFFSLHAASQGKIMGFGDGKLVFLLGILLPPPQLTFALFLAFCSGAVVGIILILLRKKSMRSEVPFGPFLIGGAFASLLFGGPVISWYVSLMPSLF